MPDKQTSVILLTDRNLYLVFIITLFVVMGVSSIGKLTAVFYSGSVIAVAMLIVILVF